MSDPKLSQPVTETGLHRALEAVVGEKRRRLDMWRLSVTVFLITLGGDHVGMWDIDSVLRGGRINVQDVVVIVSAVAAILSSFRGKQ